MYYSFDFIFESNKMKKRYDDNSIVIIIEIMDSFQHLEERGLFAGVLGEMNTYIKFWDGLLGELLKDKPEFEEYDKYLKTIIIQNLQNISAIVLLKMGYSFHDWMINKKNEEKRKEKHKKSLEPVSWKEIISGIKWNNEVKEKIQSWEKKKIVIGKDIPKTGGSAIPPDDEGEWVIIPWKIQGLYKFGSVGGERYLDINHLKKQPELYLYIDWGAAKQEKGFDRLVKDTDVRLVSLVIFS